MSTNNVVNRPDLSVWQPVLLRLTGFLSPSARLDDQDWWTDIVGELPETKTTQPRTGEQVEEGPCENGRLVLSRTPIRLDWRYATTDGPVSQFVKFPTLGEFPEVLKTFDELMNRWFDLETCPSLVRMAFGAILLQPVEGHEAGYRLLSRYLPFDLDPEGSSDFLYQINRRRDSHTKIEGLRVNRLSKWSVLTGRNIITPLPTLTPVRQSEVLHACRLELDINTAQEFDGELEPEQLPKVFSELIDLGQEIAERGDIP